MKSAVTALQELMFDFACTPEFECIAQQSGPHHQPMFEYRCKAFGIVATALGRSKKHAKREVARVMLYLLSQRGYQVPPQFAMLGDPTTMMPNALADTQNYVALLKELCQHNDLMMVEYEVVDNIGPPYQRQYTIKARFGLTERFGTATTRRVARQLAAEQLYLYLRENLARISSDNKDLQHDAEVQSHKKVMKRHCDSGDEHPRRAVLGRQDHKGPFSRIDERMRTRAQAVLRRSRSLSPKQTLEAMADVLNFDVEYTGSSLQRSNNSPLCKVELKGCSPDVSFTGNDQTAAATSAMRYLRQVFCTTKDSKPDTMQLPTVDLTAVDILCPAIANLHITAIEPTETAKIPSDYDMTKF